MAVVRPRYHPVAIIALIILGNFALAGTFAAVAILTD